MRPAANSLLKAAHLLPTEEFLLLVAIRARGVLLLPLPHATIEIKQIGMSRTDGRKVVAIATAGMVGVLGFAQLYLPYYADRDKLRGLSEEEDMPPAAREEMRRTMMAMQRQQAQEGGGGGGGGAAAAGMGGPPQQQQQKPRAAGSMWKNIGGGNSS